MRQSLDDMLRMVYTRDEGMSDTELGLDEADTLCFYLEDGFEAYWLGSTRAIPDKGDLRDYWIKILGGRVELGCQEDTLLGVLLLTLAWVGDTLAWVASRPGRQQVVAAGALEVTEDAPVFDEGALAVPVLVQAPQPPRMAALTRTIA
nr:hypothetical protein [Tanacetum cinerariifolium]